MYPSLTDYISAVEIAQETLSTLNYLRPVRKANGQPFFSSGNFAVVFKMEDTRTGQNKALKCFLREVPDRARRLRLIAEYIEANPAPYLLPMTYHTNELWVDCQHCYQQEFDVVLMPWVEGQTLGEFVRDHIQGEDRSMLERVVIQFDCMACWLIEQPFAHGDLKPDNILVTYLKDDKRKYIRNLFLIDYDGCFVPALTGEMTNENGTPPYCPPQRNPAYFSPYSQDNPTSFNSYPPDNPTYFNRHSDNFALLIISLELHIICENSKFYNNSDSLVLTIEAIQQPFSNPIWIQLNALGSRSVSARIGLLMFALNVDAQAIDEIEKPLLLILQLTAPVRYNRYSFANGTGFKDNNDRIVIPPIYKNVHSVHDVDVRGKPIDDAGFIWFKEGFVVVSIEDENMGTKRGSIDITGKIIIPLIYDKVGNFSEGLAKVGIYENGQWSFGFVDRTGQIVIPLVYQYAESFENGLARVTNDEGTGYINKIGQVIIPLIYNRTQSFKNGFLIVEKYQEYGLVDNMGNFHIPLIYDMIEIYDAIDGFVEKLIRVRKDEKFGLVNSEGETVIPVIYDDITHSYRSYFHEGLAIVKQNNKYGFVDKTGCVVIPLIYSKVNPFHNGLAIVCQDDGRWSDRQWGVIGKKGETIIPLIYDEVHPVGENLIWVKGDKIFNHSGEIVVQPIYAEMGYRFYEGLLNVKQGEKWGFIDKNGEMVVPAIYDSVEYCFDSSTKKLWMSDLRRWNVNRGGKLAYISRFGNEYWDD